MLTLLNQNLYHNAHNFFSFITFLLVFVSFCFVFLRRAVAQRCPNPPMLNLISFGGQHQGEKLTFNKCCLTLH